MRKPQINKLIFIIVNLYVFISVLIISTMALFTKIEMINGISYLRYFTTLSNIYAGIVSLVFAIHVAINFDSGVHFSRRLSNLYLSSAVGLTLTFLVTAFFLGPTFAMKGTGYFSLFNGSLFCLHFFNPMLVLFSYILFIKADTKKFDFFIGIIPMVIYAIFYSSMTMSGAMEEFYGFTFGGHFAFMPLILLVMLIVVCLISLGLFMLNKKVRKLEI